MATPLVLVSACLAGDPCRYDGRAMPDAEAVAMVARGEGLALCAEQLGGLATPRVPAEIRGGDGDDVLNGRARVVTRDGVDVTDAFVRGAQAVADEVSRRGMTGAVLQGLSPSCGCGRVYDGSFDGSTTPGDGVLAALLRRRGVELRSVRGIRTG